MLCSWKRNHPCRRICFTPFIYKTMTKLSFVGKFSTAKIYWRSGSSFEICRAVRFLTYFIKFEYNDKQLHSTKNILNGARSLDLFITANVLIFSKQKFFQRHFWLHIIFIKNRSWFNILKPRLKYVVWWCQRDIFNLYYYFFSMIGTLFPLPRVLYSMASDGLLFNVFAKVNKKTNTPFWGTIICGLFAGMYLNNSVWSPK